MRWRALEIIHHLGRQSSDEQFLDFCLHSGEECDLEEAFGLLAQTQYPGINLLAYQAVFDHWAAVLLERIGFAINAEQILGMLNQFLFGELGFKSCGDNSEEPELFYLNRVVDNRLGNADSLGLIYMLMARRLQLPVVSIGLPGHLRYQSSLQVIYIDASDSGKILSKADCIRQVLNKNPNFPQGWVSPISPRRVLLRICANLHQTYANFEMREEAIRIQRYLIALAK